MLKKPWFWIVLIAISCAYVYMAYAISVSDAPLLFKVWLLFGQSL